MPLLDRWARPLCVALASGVADGCSVDDCVFAHFIADLPASVRYGGRDTLVAFSGGVSPEIVGPRVFSALDETLLTGSGPFNTIILSIDGTLGDLGWGELGIAVPTPLNLGVTRVVDTVFRQRGWGESLLPPGSQGAVSLLVGGFEAVDAAGAVTVRTRSPLDLGVDLRIIGAGGDTIALGGELTIRYYPETGSCAGIAQRVAGF